jgi:hypothetical protein
MSAAEEAMMRHTSRLGAISLLALLCACAGPGRHYGREQALYGPQRSQGVFQPAYGGDQNFLSRRFPREQTHSGGFHPGN